MPGEWRDAVRRWRELRPLRDGGAPDASEEYLILQTLLGAWPIEAERLDAYLEKALREAKRNTNWVEQDHDYEARGAGLRAPRCSTTTAVPRATSSRSRRVSPRAAERAALGQLAAQAHRRPGMPDVYQGDELEDLSLVDPDNRRPVDWARAARGARRARAAAPRRRRRRSSSS